MRVTQDLLEQAAQLCSMAASYPEHPPSMDSLVLDTDADPDAGDIADEAWLEVMLRTPVGSNQNISEVYAEAEALLRTGWSPPC